jgi:hypothetical protein
VWPDSVGANKEHSIRRFSIALALSTLLLVSLASAQQTAAAAVAKVPRFEPSPCPASPVKALANARCGYLVVPEDRGRPDSGTIRLIVAIVPAGSARSEPAPVVYLAGGPGGIALHEADVAVATGLNRDRDLILMDQRGTLYSEPALTCPEVDQFFVPASASPWMLLRPGACMPSRREPATFAGRRRGATSPPTTRPRTLPTSPTCARRSESRNGTCSGPPTAAILGSR